MLPQSSRFFRFFGNIPFCHCSLHSSLCNTNLFYSFISEKGDKMVTHSLKSNESYVTKPTHLLTKKSQSPHVLTLTHSTCVRDSVCAEHSKFFWELITKTVSTTTLLPSLTEFIPPPEIPVLRKLIRSHFLLIDRHIDTILTHRSHKYYISEMVIFLQWNIHRYYANYQELPGIIAVHSPTNNSLALIILSNSNKFELQLLSPSMTL